MSKQGYIEFRDVILPTLTLERVYPDRAAVVAAMPAVPGDVNVLSWLDGNRVLAVTRSAGATPIPDMPGWAPNSPDVAHFGAGAAAVSAMLAYAGYVRVGAPLSLASSVSITGPLYVEPGAYITVAAGATLTVVDVIEAPRQWIFRGDGSVTLGGTGYNGEDARMVHASWFGAIPGPPEDGGQAPAIQRAATAMGNARESLIEFDIGNYHLGSQVTLTRGCCIRGVGGDGTRKTVFRALNDSTALFVTGGDACQFVGVQFEAAVARTHPIVETNHVGTRVLNCNSFNAGQLVKGGSAAIGLRVADIHAAYGAAGGSGSSLIEVAASNCQVENVFLPTSAVGPEAIVRIKTASNIFVSGIQWQSPAHGVVIDAADGSVSRFSIGDLICTAYTANCPAMVGINTSGSSSVTDGRISDLVGTALVECAVEINQGSTGQTSRISIAGAVLQNASSLDGVRLTRTNGTLSSVSIADCMFSGRANPVLRSGAMSEISVAPGILAKSTQPLALTVSIADDAVHVVDLAQNKFSSRLSVVTNNGEFGTWRARAATGPAITAMGTVSGITATTGALTGTTGADGAITVSVAASGLYYLENRSGASITAMIEVAG